MKGELRVVILGPALIDMHDWMTPYSLLQDWRTLRFRNIKCNSFELYIANKATDSGRQVIVYPDSLTFIRMLSPRQCSPHDFI